MEPREPRLKVIYAASARAELDQIWDYNERTYSREHASDYLDFIQRGIEALAIEP